MQNRSGAKEGSMTRDEDVEIRDKLRQIDNDSSIDVSAWEADFLESILHKQTGPLSEKQRIAANKMIDKYL